MIVMSKTGHLVAGLLLGCLVAILAFAVSTKIASAQDPTRLALENYKVLLENSQLRAIEYRLKPGEKEPMHSHPCGVFVYYFSEAKIKTTFPDGKTVEASSKVGDVLWRDPITHAGENIGITEAHALLVEPKNGCCK
jgi:quercetin dioxygenase-like cupin family protein